MFHRRMTPIVLGVLLALLAPLAGLGQSPPSAVSQGAGWPRTFTSPKGTVTLYQPQVESWNQIDIKGRAAVQATDAGRTQPSYGVVWFTAKTEIVKDRRLVLLYDCRFTKASFPGTPDNGAAWIATLQANLGNQNGLVSLDQLQASLAANGDAPKARTVAVRNDVPTIILSTSPAMLVTVYGDPDLRPVQGTSLKRVMNTPALMVTDPATGTFYFYLTDRWLQAPALAGPWAPAATPPATLATALQAATKAKNADLFQDPSPALKDALKKGTLPIVHVATTPTELVVTEGAPRLEKVAGTGLEWVSNTRSDLFYQARTKTYYILLSGRWFASPSLTGSWCFIPGRQLPADFSRIPPDHARAAVLVSVPGTPEAQEAAIASSIPQTATITRSGVGFTARYDGGAPRFQPIAGTSLQYAVNSVIPVIGFNSTSFYAVDSGVWFSAPSPAGPWAVTDYVPQAIYEIPPSSPIYNVTYVKVYSHTPDTVVFGYTPGYYGTVINMDGDVVYGTGYVYPAWVGTDLIVAPPVTYGCGAAFAWGAASGFMLGYATSAFWGPGWGWGWGWGPGWGWGGNWTVNNNWNFNHDSTHSWNNWNGKGAWSSSSNAYGKWGNAAYAGTRSTWGNPSTGNTGQGFHGGAYNTRTGTYGHASGFQETTGSGRTAEGIHGETYNPTTHQVNSWSAAKGGNNVYASHDGQVYRNDGGQGWQKYTPGGWQNTNVERSGAAGSTRSSWASHENTAREAGFNRSNAFHSEGSWNRSNYGGGYRGGSFGMGGFRGGFGGFHGGRR